jgi:hypothetical protein
MNALAFIIRGQVVRMYQILLAVRHYITAAERAFIVESGWIDDILNI